MYFGLKVVMTYQKLFEGGIDEFDRIVSTWNLPIQPDAGKKPLAGRALKFRVGSRVA